MELTPKSRQKQKLLVLQKILLTESDENHKLSGNDLIKKLDLYGIKAERKTIYDDIATLIESGLDVVVEKQGHSNVYYIGSRIFQDEELLVLVDAVASSRFLTQKKSNELIKKLQSLTSRHGAQQLKRSIYVANRVKNYNEAIYYSVNAIHEAIHKNCQITFRYTEYDINKRKRFKHGGDAYKVSPYYLIWESDCYYLVCYCTKHEEICRYRVDRMSDVTVIKSKRRELSITEEEFAKSLRATYNMYGGKAETVTLEMQNKLVNVLIDRFGDSIHITPRTQDTFAVRLEVQISPTFWGWLFQFGDEAKVVSPEWVVNEANTNLKKMLRSYE